MAQAPAKISELLSQMRYFQWMKAWKRCAGPVLFRQVRFLGIHRQGGSLCLRIEVPDPVWRQELIHQKTEILARYAQALQEEGISAQECPTEWSLGPVAAVPLKARYAQKGRDKGRV